MTRPASLSVSAPAALPAPARRPGTPRRAVCLLTILACVPYVGLKIAWLAGSTVGWNDTAAAEDGALQVGNAITMAMDVVAIAVVLAFTYAWGRRIPAWLVLVPIWVGGGLLAPIVLGLPVGMVLQVLTGSAASTSAGGDGLRGWVYVMVYGGFTAQGLGLLTAFVFYARDRWPELFTLRTRDLPQGATGPIQSLLASGGALLAVVYAVPHLYWAFGGTAGLSGDLPVLSAAQQTVELVYALLAVAGAAGLLAMVRRRGGGGRAGLLWVPLTAAWVGAGATFCWSLYSLLVILGRPGFLASDSSALGGLTPLGGLIAGLTMALTLVFLLAEATAQSARPMASSRP